MKESKDDRVVEQDVGVDQMMGQEIDLLEYILVILRNKYHIIILSITLATIAFVVCSLLPVIYSAHVQLAIMTPEKLGGVSPDAMRAPEVVTLVERGFVNGLVYDNQQERVLAKMKSKVFIQYFIQKNDLLPYIFSKDWDTKKKQWKDDFKPDLLLATRIFKEKHNWIKVDIDTQLIEVGINWNNPKKAALLANTFADNFNEYMKFEEIEKTNTMKVFLMKELSKTKIIEMRKSIYRLMETQLVIKMLASSKKQHTVEILDPAVPPIEKSSPAKKKITLLTLIGTMLLSITYLIGRVIFMKIRVAIEGYENEVGEKGVERPSHLDDFISKK
jgi:LPS O-antigen subunit length determinant protein (WzzB/FepE family)